MLIQGMPPSTVSEDQDYRHKRLILACWQRFSKLCCSCRLDQVSTLKTFNPASVSVIAITVNWHTDFEA